MQLSAIPIIHARTKDVDFRSNLLVVPDFFTLNDIKWCHTYITESTRFFEMVDKKGRNVLFSNESYVVIGVSIFVRDLYEQCNKVPQYHFVDGFRTNYAFVGFLFQKKDVAAPFNIPYELYLEEYEKIMKTRWSDPMNNPQSLLPERVSFGKIEFPDSEVYKPCLKMPLKTRKVILDSTEFSAEALISEIITNIHTEHDISFCSDLPNAASFIDSHFRIGTSVYAKLIDERLNRDCNQKPQRIEHAESSLFTESMHQSVDSIGSLCSENNFDESVTGIEKIKSKLKNSGKASHGLSVYTQIENMMNSVKKPGMSTEKEDSGFADSVKKLVSKRKKSSDDSKLNVNILFIKRGSDTE